MIFKLYIKDHNGVAAVEFSMIAPILLLLLIGTVDYGMFISNGMKLQNTANTVADFVATAENDEDIQIVAEETYNGDFNEITVASEFVCQCADGVASTCPINCGSNDYQRRYTSINVSGNFETLFPYPGLPDSIEITKTVKMRVD